ncbi:hypothetical protein CEV33_0528 [Brucella grignonensis]|uniref:Uncharacterized protein n=1 Tax=Brucella grignonensis TaxID=94627 RepID=A0A256FG47_9HYPH|nr:hypothetical protein CEV33_0528 [Brucella grignonensis]
MRAFTKIRKQGADLQPFIASYVAIMSLFVIGFAIYFLCCRANCLCDNYMQQIAAVFL